MKFTGTVFVSLLALAVPSFAQNDTESAPSEYAQSVLEALEEAGLTTLASAITALSATPAGESFLEELEQGSKTVFAPTNEAITAAGYPEDFASISEEEAGELNLDALAQILLYHVVDEEFEVEDIGVSPNTTIVDTLLVTSEDDGDEEADDEEIEADVINFPNGTAVPLVLTRESEDGEGFQIFNNGEPIEVTSEAVEVENLQVYVIEQIITLPPSLGEVAESAGLTALAGVLTDSGLLETLNASTGGLTIFAPNDAAFEAIGADLEELDDEQIALILQNHVINGTVALSDDVADEDAEDEEDSDILPIAGPAFTFSTNETGTFVTSGNATAQIVGTDYLFNGGVVHVIDTVLVNEEPEVNPPPTQTGGGGGSPTGTGGSETSTPAGEDNEDNGNGASAIKMPWGLGAAVVSFGAVIGGGLVAL